MDGMDGSVGAVSGRLSRTVAARRGQASAAQGPKSRSVRTTRPVAVSGSNHTKVPARPKCPQVRGLFVVAVQCGDLWPRISTPSPQGLGSWAPKPGRTPARSGKAGVVIVVTVSGARRRPVTTAVSTVTRSLTDDRYPWAAEPERSVARRSRGTTTAWSAYSSNAMPVAAATCSARISKPTLE